MRLRLINTIFRKEIDDGIRSKYVLLSILFMPLLFSVIMPLMTVVPLLAATPQDIEEDFDVGGLNDFALTSDWEELNDLQKWFIISVEFLNLLFLLIPMILPTVIAADTFVGEKDRGTVEAILSAPVTDTEIYFGKMLAAAIPSILSLWLSSIPYIIIINFVSIRILDYYYLPNMMFIIIVLIYTPLVALVATNFMIWISTRTKSTRDAQQFGGLIVIPLLIFIMALVGSSIIVSQYFLVVGIILLIVLDVLTMKWGIQLLDRDKLILSS